MTSLPDPRSERPLEEPTTALEPRYLLALYVNGASAHAARAILDTRALCDVHLTGLCHLSIVDLDDDSSDTERVFSGRELGAPTLVRHWPAPRRTLAGDLSDVDKVLEALHLPRIRPPSGELGQAMGPVSSAAGE